MQINWLSCYKRTRYHEGGNDDDPHDPGGRTSRGITQREYDAYRKNKGLPQLDVWKAPESDITDIYLNDYWRASRADQLQSGVDLIVFDGAVNSGIAQATKWAQRAVNAQGKKLNVDGIIGPQTVAALNECEPKALIESMCDQRLAMLRTLSTWPRYRGGWTSRVEDMRKTALGMVGAMSAPAAVENVPVAEAAPAPKAPISDKSPVELLKTPEGLAGATGVVGSLLTAAGSGGPLAWAVAAVILIATIIGGIYFLKRMREQV